MERDILAVLENENKRFSKGQKLIAKYILENYDKAAFMTAGKLGNMVGVSESTVVRFASELGYDGYPEMRKAIQEMIRSRLTSVQRIEVAKELMNEETVLESVLCSDMEKLQITLDECDKESFAAAVDSIINANHIYIVGMRSSTCLANFMGFYLNLLLENVHIIQDTTVSEVYEQIIRIKEGDVFIGISYPRYSSRTVKAMKFAKSTGAKVIGITDGMNSPFVDVSDILLFAKSDMVSFLDSLVAPLSLINALIVSVGTKSKDNVSNIFNRLETIWADYEVYEHSKL
ncbi:MAG: MurR/RpiR family transcriptional regulator [Oscillospiraceae bacterium]|nr:MurR/RpiR family transcriptional regulator [Oscillospiraceae bacterium]